MRNKFSIEFYVGHGGQKAEFSSKTKTDCYHPSFPLLFRHQTSYGVKFQDRFNADTPKRGYSDKYVCIFGHVRSGAKPGNSLNLPQQLPPYMCHLSPSKVKTFKILDDFLFFLTSCNYIIVFIIYSQKRFPLQSHTINIHQDDLSIRTFLRFCTFSQMRPNVNDTINQNRTAYNLIQKSFYHSCGS